MEFRDRLSTWADTVNGAIEAYVKEKDTPERNIYTAMKYSLTAGGKRLRPVLALAADGLLGGSGDDIMPFACAIEMIHTYSLIHDDLPAMDNDDYRRGRLTSHKVFGEAMAILAGDALLNKAFEVMLEYTGECARRGEDPHALAGKLEAMEIIARAAGSGGMIGGQVVDLESEGKSIQPGILEYMHRCKTGALIKAPVMAAAAVRRAGRDERDRLECYASNIGLAFQIKDDILDVEGSLEGMGKAAGSDAANGKSTFVTLYGLEQSAKLLKSTTEKAVEALKPFGSDAEFLTELAQYLVNRNN